MNIFSHCDSLTLILRDLLTKTGMTYRECRHGGNMEIYAMGFITDKDIASTTQKELKLLEICNYMIKLFPVQVQIKQKKKETE